MGVPRGTEDLILGNNFNALDVLGKSPLLLTVPTEFGPGHRHGAGASSYCFTASTRRSTAYRLPRAGGPVVPSRMRQASTPAPQVPPGSSQRHRRSGLTGICTRSQAVAPRLAGAILRRWAGFSFMFHPVQPWRSDFLNEPIPTRIECSCRCTSTGAACLLAASERRV